MGSDNYTLISPGTELAAFYQGSRFPGYPGYAAVFQVDLVVECSGREQEGMR